MITLIEKPPAEATMLEIIQQAIARHLHIITNKRGDIYLCSIIPRGWKLHRIHIKPGRAAA